MKKSLIPTEGNYRRGRAYRISDQQGKVSPHDRVVVSVTPNTTMQYNALCAFDENVPTGECCTTYKRLNDRHLYQLNQIQ